MCHFCFVHTVMHPMTSDRVLHLVLWYGIVNVIVVLLYKIDVSLIVGAS